MSRRRDERGMSLAELLVGMVISMMVMGVLVTGAVAIYRANNYTDQDSETLGALRTALDRFEKEARQGRRIYSTSTSSRVYLWVDYDRDNQQDLVEKITWSVVQTSTGVAELRR